MMTGFRFVLMALTGALVLGLSACQSGGVDTSMPAEDLQTITFTDYQLGSGDRLRVNVFGEPELSGEFVVDGAGEVSLPLIGNVRVVGMTVTAFQRDIERRLRNGYLNNPQISAEVTNYRPYYILGEVNQPGEYPYISGLTVMNAVATASGFTYRANKRHVFIRSDGQSSERKVELSSATPVQPGDTIRIDERIF